MAVRNVSRGSLNKSKCGKEGWEKVGIPSITYAADIVPWLKGTSRKLDLEQNRTDRAGWPQPGCPTPYPAPARKSCRVTGSGSIDRRLCHWLADLDRA